MYILGEFDANFIPGLTLNLTNQLAKLLNVSSADLTNQDIRTGNIYDPVTRISTPITQFSFDLNADTFNNRSEIESKLRLLATGEKKLIDPNEYELAIPAEQNFVGSVSCNISDDGFYFQYNISGQSSVIFGRGFDLFCISSESDALSAIRNFLINDEDSMAKATTLNFDQVDCPNRRIYFSYFNLRILNDFSDVFGDNNASFVAIQNQLNNLINGTPDYIDVISLSSFSVTGIFNGQSTDLFDSSINLHLLIISLPAPGQRPFSNLMNLYEKQWSIFDARNRPLNVPAQFYNGSLKTPIAVQSISFQLKEYNKKSITNYVRVFADHIFRQLSQIVQIPQYFFTFDSFRPQLGIFKFNLTSYSINSTMDINQANATLYQLISTDNLMLTDLNNRTYVAGSPPSEKFSWLTITTGWISRDKAQILMPYLCKQLTALLNSSDKAIACPSVDIGEIVDPKTKIATRFIEVNFRLFSTPNATYLEQLEKLASLLTNGTLMLTDFDGGNLTIPIRQHINDDSTGYDSTFVKWPVQLKPSSGAPVLFNLSCAGNYSSYNMTDLIGLLREKLQVNQNASQLTVNVTDQSYVTDCQTEFFICINPVRITVVNGHYANVGFAQFVEFAKNDSWQMINSSAANIIDMDVRNIGAPELPFDKPPERRFSPYAVEIPLVVVTLGAKDQVRDFADYSYISLFVVGDLHTGLMEDVRQRLGNSINLNVVFFNVSQFGQCEIFDSKILISIKMVELVYRLSSTDHRVHQ